MFSITPIGSCRITTPLRRGQAIHGFELNMDRCYGYCHSPAEAVQMAGFFQGSATISDEVWPLVSRAHDLGEMLNSAHTPSDLYVIELASAKQVTIDGISIQLNYLKSVYSDFFEDAERVNLFWAFATVGNGNELMEFLDHEWSATPQQRSDSDMLGRMHLQLVTPESLRRDIRVLSDMLPDVLFVSHVDANKPDGNLIRSRSEFINLVEAEVKSAGCKFYNPTDLMHEFGQTAAIEDESTGLAHFTECFADSLIEDWMCDVIAPMTDNAVRLGVSSVDRKLQPQIAAARLQGKMVDIRARLEALAVDTTEVLPLLEESRLAQAQVQAAFLQESSALVGKKLRANEAIHALKKGCEFGLFDSASELARTYPAVLATMSAHELMGCASRARRGAATEVAGEFFLAAAKKGSRRAFSVLAKQAIENGSDLLASLTAQQRSDLLATVEPVERLQLLLLAGTSFSEIVSGMTTARDAVQMVTYLAANHGIGDAAEILACWCEHQISDRITDEALLAILDEWIATALVADTLIDRIHGLNAVLIAAPLYSPARNAMRDIRKELSLRIRAAGNAGDMATLDALTAEANALNSELPELDLWRARLRFAAGEYETALELGQSAAAHLPEKINVWVLLMRSAVKIGDRARAVEFADKVVSLATPETRNLKAEAKNVLKSKLVEA